MEEDKKSTNNVLSSNYKKVETLPIKSGDEVNKLDKYIGKEVRV
jgi:hypothetical protein